MIEHVVVSGCSFTADGIGGSPPNPTDLKGSCSFIKYDGIETAEPRSWIGFVAQALKVTSLVNLAAGGHGNALVAINLINVLSRHNYDPSKTLVLFNITDPARLDLVCDYYDIQASRRVSWPSTVLPYSFLDPGSRALQQIKHQMGVEQIELFSSTHLQGLFGWLKSQGYRFRFLTMRDYTQCEPLWSAIAPYYTEHIPLEEFQGMMEFVQHRQSTISQQDTHPNLQGHSLIAQCVLVALGHTKQE